MDTGIWTNLINWLALAISIALLIYGVVGLAAGRVDASSYAFMNDKTTDTGTKAKFLSVLWILGGLLGIVAFGGHMLGIQAVAPLYDGFMFMLKSS